MMQTLFWKAAAPIVCALMTASCAGSSRISPVAPARLALPETASRPCALATLPAAPTLAGPPAPSDGRAGACYRALVDRYGETKITAWLGAATWRDDELLLESDFSRQRVENEFGGILRLFDIEAKAGA